ncbi:MAG: AAA family ATPase [Planctomycetota bacterium]|nr:AAA family ATPase [Planctomycetota bacterium]
MKIAITGKGGVGKTTFSSLLTGALALQGRNVIAIDADPDANFGSGLGLPPGEQVTPLSEMEDLIAERTGARDNYGGYFTLNPKVDDIPETFARRIGPIHLLALGGIKHGGSGCICPASALVKALLTHVVLGRDDAVVMDMEAGLEHLGRATAISMDALLVVVNDTPWSVQTALRIRQLAGDIGITKLFAVANLIKPTSDLAAIAARLEGIPLVGHLPFDGLLGEGMFLGADHGDVRPSPGLQKYLPVAQGVLAALTSSSQ